MTTKSYSEKDITYVLTVRLSEVTPWILERIEFCLNFYHPAPQVLLLDFGSKDEYSTLIQHACQAAGARYIKINDDQTFSAAKAKNLAFQYIDTDLMLLSDIDCVFDQDIFKHLAKDATLLEFDLNPRRYITFPVTHLAKNISETFSQLSTEEKVKSLRQFDYYSHQAEFKKDIEFIAPYSNILFMHKKLYDMSGGYCDIFRGHGSEDFEYLIRLGYLTSDLPKPRNLNRDFYGPLKDSFWQANSYEGFRKYLEALTFSSENLGYKTYHLWHPKPSEQGYWTQKNDWKRERFNQILGLYQNKEEKILELDYHPREKTALCLMNDADQWGYFLPLRLLGYHLDIASRNEPNEIHSAYKKIIHRQVDLVCIFNPYMKSHKEYFGLIELAKQHEIEVKIVERGALPNTLYYANEVAYNDPDYYDESRIKRNILTKNLKQQDQLKVRTYIDNLRQGQQTLEHMQGYEQSSEQLKTLLSPFCTNIFIPLQLPDDMAVSYFNESHQPYAHFVDNIQLMAMKYPNIQFFIKPHPLMPNIQGFAQHKNITLLNDLNIHAILDHFKHVVVYNSGVGLLAILHGLQPYSIGNSFYSLNNRLTHEVLDLEQAIRQILASQSHAPTFEPKLVEQFIYWLYEKKYSTFIAQDKMRDFGERLAHGYKNIQVQRFNFEHHIQQVGGAALFPYSAKSYISSKVIREIKAPQSTTAEVKKAVQPIAQQTVQSLQQSASKRKLRKLMRNPKQFMLDALKNRLGTNLSA
jgi:predicted glycosyltransferase involved in capsule biosynthesis